MSNQTVWTVKIEACGGDRDYALRAANVVLLAAALRGKNDHNESYAWGSASIKCEEKPAVRDHQITAGGLVKPAPLIKLVNGKYKYEEYFEKP